MSYSVGLKLQGLEKRSYQVWDCAPYILSFYYSIYELIYPSMNLWINAKFLINKSDTSYEIKCKNISKILTNL